MDKYAAEIDHVLDRVHRHARPRTDIDVLVVQVVHGPVERPPVDQPMDPVEMEDPPERDQHQNRHEIEGIIDDLIDPGKGQAA